jgi:hypothetical protein
MPSAAAKKKRAANRAAQTAHTDTCCPCADDQQLQDEIVAFNDSQQQINADRKDLLKRIAAHSTQHSMDTHMHSHAAAGASEQQVQHSKDAADASEQQVQQGCHIDNVIAELQQQLSMADRPSQSGGTTTESHRQQAPNINPLAILQSTYPERLKIASSKAVEELLDLLHLYAPPSEPEDIDRKAFETQVYDKVKRILRNQKQRAYRKTKKLGLL